jgi:hypothetical protein
MATALICSLSISLLHKTFEYQEANTKREILDKQCLWTIAIKEIGGMSRMHKERLCNSALTLVKGSSQDGEAAAI